MVEERNLKISKRANKFIMSLSANQRKPIKKAIDKLIDGDTTSLDIKKLLPYPKEFRLRVGDIRILFKSTREELFIFKADYRGDVYKR